MVRWLVVACALTATCPAWGAAADEPRWLPQLVLATDPAQLRRKVVTVRVESPPWRSVTAFASGGLGFGPGTDNEFALGVSWYPVLGRAFDFALAARAGWLDHRATDATEGERVGVASTGWILHGEAAWRWWWSQRVFTGLGLGAGPAWTETTARCCGGVATTVHGEENQFAVGLLVGYGFGRL